MELEFIKQYSVVVGYDFKIICIGYNANCDCFEFKLLMMLKLLRVIDPHCLSLI